MSELPPNWQWTTIGAVADIQLGRQRSPKNHNGPNMRPYLRAANVTWSGIDLTDVKEMNFDPSEAANFRLEPGDLLLNEASGSPREVGKPAIWRGEIDGCCFQNTLLRVQSRGPSIAYLYWYCRAVALRGEFGEAGRGVNIRHLGKHGLAAFPIPLPPKHEQERIVAAIEELVSRLDVAAAAVRSARRRLSLLWDATLREVFDPDWVRPKLDSVNVEDRPICYGILKPRTVAPGVVPYVEVRSISKGQIKVDELHKTTEELHKAFPRSVLRSGDVVLAIRGSFDRAAVVPDSLDGANVSRDVAKISPIDQVLPDFLAAFLVSPEARRYFAQHARGVAVQGVNIGDLRQLPVPLPTIDQQKSALERIQDVRLVNDRITAELERAESRARRLRGSISAAAFCGQLVPQDPDDESASSLLAQIGSGGVDVGSTKKRTKKRAS